MCKSITWVCLIIAAIFFLIAVVSGFTHSKIVITTTAHVRLSTLFLLAAVNFSLLKLIELKSKEV